MFQFVRNLILAFLTISVVVTGCGKSNKKRVRLPMRQSSGQQKTCDPKTTDCSKAGDDQAGNGDGDGSPAIDTKDENIAEQTKREKDYEETHSGLEDGTDSSFTDLVAGDYVLTNVATELLVHETTVGVLTTRDFPFTPNSVGKTNVKGAASEMTDIVDNVPTKLNVVSKFTLANKDNKLEVSKSELFGFQSQADFTKPQTVGSANKTIANADANASVLDLINQQVDKFKKDLDLEASVGVVKLGDNEIRIRVEVTLKNKDTRILFFTYKVTPKTDTEAATTET